MAGIYTCVCGLEFSTAKDLALHGAVDHNKNPFVPDYGTSVRDPLPSYYTRGPKSDSDEDAKPRLL